MSEKKEIVGFTAGNFDLMHPGYIYTFEDARKHCDKFIVFLQETHRYIENPSTNQWFHYMKDIEP